MSSAGLAAQDPTADPAATRGGAQARVEWPGFRGPHRNGVAADQTPPTTWDATHNIAWQLDLPGPGSSSPVIVGSRLFLTCYSGYGVGDAETEPGDLVHHILCIDRQSGEPIWERKIPGQLDGPASRMQLGEHGFASPTPVTDGEVLYTYFGKVGLVACDLRGDILWQQTLGNFDYEAGVDPLGDQRLRQPDGTPISLRWGAAASPLLFGDLVIVNASEDSDSIRALDRRTGDLVWKRHSPFLEGCAISPILAGAGEHQVLIQVLGGAVWGMDPATGKLLWEEETQAKGGMSPTPVVDAKRVYVFGGSGKSRALRFDAGDGPRLLWESRNQDIPSPVLHDGVLYAVLMKGMACAIQAADGEVLSNPRLEGRTGDIYASPTLAGGHLYVVSRERGVFVYAANPELPLVAHNTIQGDDSRFDASPAVVDDRIYLRSGKRLYCIAHDRHPMP